MFAFYLFEFNMLIILMGTFLELYDKMIKYWGFTIKNKLYILDVYYHYIFCQESDQNINLINGLFQICLYVKFPLFYNLSKIIVFDFKHFCD